MGYGYYPRYVTVAEKRARAEKKIKQLRKKNKDIQPVILQGQALATTWWGKAWNRNLEGYADYSNRIGRGRSYVRHLAVVDLQITPGLVKALVQGTRGAPYEVQIEIDEIKEKNWKLIREKCQAQLSSLPDLLAGKIPGKLRDIFMVQGEGLFPSPNEISFACSCPDWASMCKHVAATLYGIGARLDEDPTLFFTLRKADMNELISRAVQDRADAIIEEKTTVGSGRVIEDEQLSSLFGIDLEDFAVAPPRQGGEKTGRSMRTEKVPVALSGKRNSKKRSGKKSAHKNKMVVGKALLPPGYGSATALVLACIEESGQDGLSIQDLVDITAIPAKSMYPILQRLKKNGQINNLARGVYGVVV